MFTNSFSLKRRPLKTEIAVTILSTESKNFTSIAIGSRHLNLEPNLSNGLGKKYL